MGQGEKDEENEEVDGVSKVSEEGLGVFGCNGDYECGCHRLWPGRQRSTLSGAILLVTVFKVMYLHDF